jgi:hypothetical protein
MASSPEMNKLGDELYRHWERAMGSWWDQVLETPAFLGAMGQNLEAMANARGQYERAVDDTAERFHLPSRSDVVRVARVASMLEDRLLQQEDLILGLQDQLARLEREAVQARIEAAEARIELRDTLVALRGQIAAAASVAPTATAATATAASAVPSEGAAVETPAAPAPAGGRGRRGAR